MAYLEYITLKHENEMLCNQIKSLKEKLKDLENFDGDTIEMAGYKRGVKETIDKAKEAFGKACGWLSTYPWYQGVVEEFVKAMEEEL